MSDNHQIDLTLLACDDWHKLRDLRLAALQDSPNAFLANYEQEAAYPNDWWQQELDRGRWHIGMIRHWPNNLPQSKEVSLLGVTREPGMSLHECYIEYLWVDPQMRRLGVGLTFIRLILDQLMAEGVRTVLLWVLDGNDAAMRLYLRAGFVIAGPPRPLTLLPGRTEQLLRRDLPASEPPGSNLPNEVSRSMRQD